MNIKRKIKRIGALALMFLGIIGTLAVTEVPRAGAATIIAHYTGNCYYNQTTSGYDWVNWNEYNQDDGNQFVNIFVHFASNPGQTVTAFTGWTPYATASFFPVCTPAAGINNPGNFQFNLKRPGGGINNSYDTWHNFYYTDHMLFFSCNSTCYGQKRYPDGPLNYFGAPLSGSYPAYITDTPGWHPGFTNIPGSMNVIVDAVSWNGCC